MKNVAGDSEKHRYIHKLALSAFVVCGFYCTTQCLKLNVNPPGYFLHTVSEALYWDVHNTLLPVLPFVREHPHPLPHPTLPALVQH